MLMSIFRALYDLLTDAGLPVYLADCVPDQADFPYITAEIEAPLTSRSAGAVTLTFWFTEDQANSQRLSRMDRLLKQLPARGLWLTTDSGTITLRQEGNAACLREGDVQGMKTRWKLCCFPKQ